MKIAIYSRTPLAGAPWELYRALKKYTTHDVALINAFVRYADGRVFPHHLIMSSSNGVCRRKILEADVLHLHNYLTSDIISLRRDQKILAQFHSLPRLGNWKSLWKFADVQYTIAQPLQEKEYRVPGLPNLIDPDVLRPTKKGEKVRIAFAPTSRAPVGRPDSKGYHEVRSILNTVASERDVVIDWIEGVEYRENLRRKSLAHILIDDVVTGNWHRTSLEGACFACAVLNRTNKMPFVHASLKTLREKLLWLIDDPIMLLDIAERSRFWVLREWHAIDKVNEYVKAYKEVLRAS